MRKFVSQIITLPFLLAVLSLMLVNNATAAEWRVQKMSGDVWVETNKPTKVAHAGYKARPAFHHLSTFLQQIGPSIGALHICTNRVRQTLFGNLSGDIGDFSSPVPERGAEPVVFHIV